MKLILFSLLSFLAVFATDTLGKNLNCYNIWEYDSLVHTLAGISVGSIGLFLAYLFRIKSRKDHYFYSMCSALTAGVIWEIHQYFFLNARYPVSDTLLDLLMDLLGGWLVAFCYLRQKPAKGLKKLLEAKSRDAIITISNIITGLGILLIALSFYGFLIENRWLLFGGLFFSGVSDIFDGFMANRLNQCTNLGKILDNLRDKLLIWAVVGYLIIIHFSIHKAAGFEILFYAGLILFCFCEIFFSILKFCWKPHNESAEPRMHLILKIRNVAIVFIGGATILDFYFKNLITTIIGPFQYISPAPTLLIMAAFCFLSLICYYIICVK